VRLFFFAFFAPFCGQSSSFTYCGLA